MIAGGLRAADGALRLRCLRRLLRALPWLPGLSGCVSNDLDDGTREALLDATVLFADAAATVAESGTAPLDAGSEPVPLDAALYPEPGRLRGITAEHNAVRARVGAAQALPELAWSTTIARVAQSYADRLAQGCELALGHSSPAERMNYGENLASFSSNARNLSAAPGSATEVIALWESERACYTFGPFQSGVHDRCSAECGKYGGCGHYTQLVWRDTLRVGCGFAECKQGQYWRSYWVCHYDPAGNILAAQPY